MPDDKKTPSSGSKGAKKTGSKPITNRTRTVGDVHPNLDEASRVIDRMLASMDDIRLRDLVHTQEERVLLRYWAEENAERLEALFAGMREGTIYICDTVSDNGNFILSPVMCIH